MRPYLIPYYVLREQGGTNYLREDEVTGYLSWTESLDAAHAEWSIADLLNWYRYTPINSHRELSVDKLDIVKVSSSVIEEVVE